MTTHYGIVGCGMMGREHLSNIALLHNTCVSVIYEPDLAMAEAAQKLAPEATFVSSLAALLKYQPLDCLIIASPNHCHIKQLETITQTVTLPILVEKPLYTHADDLARLQVIQANYQAPIWVAMEYRYMPPMQTFIKRVDAVVGNIKMLTITEHRFPFLQKVNDWNRFNKNSGGTFVEKCCHFFDLMRLILKSNPIKVMASGGQMVNHLDEQYDGIKADIWDCGYVIVDFENGARSMLELSMFAEGSEYQEMIHAVGPTGKIEVKIPGPVRFWSGVADAQPKSVVIESPRTACNPTLSTCEIDQTLLAAGDHNGSTYHQHVRFLDVIRGQADVEVTIDDGIWSVRMGMAAQESALTGKVVYL